MSNNGNVRQPRRRNQCCDKQAFRVRNKDSLNEHKDVNNLQQPLKAKEIEKKEASTLRTQILLADTEMPKIVVGNRNRCQH